MSEIELGMQWANEWFNDKSWATPLKWLERHSLRGPNPRPFNRKAWFTDQARHFPYRAGNIPPDPQQPPEFVEGAVLIFALRQSELSEV